MKQLVSKVRQWFTIHSAFGIGTGWVILHPVMARIYLENAWQETESLARQLDEAGWAIACDQQYYHQIASARLRTSRRAIARLRDRQHLTEVRLLLAIAQLEALQAQLGTLGKETK